MPEKHRVTRRRFLKGAAAAPAAAVASTAIPWPAAAASSSGPVGDGGQYLAGTIAAITSATELTLIRSTDGDLVPVRLEDDAYICREP